MDQLQDVISTEEIISMAPVVEEENIEATSTPVQSSSSSAVIEPVTRITSSNHGIYGNLRRKALEYGDVGGLPLKSKPTPENASIKIQSCWRSKLVK